MMRKRIISFLMAVVVAMTSVQISAFAAIDGNTLYGDVNADGKIDMKDDLALKRYLAGQIPSEFNVVNADVNEDGVIDEADLLMIKKYIAEWDIKLGSDIYSVSFYDGDRVIDVLFAKEDTALGEVPAVGKSSKENAILLGYYTDEACTQQFYAENPVTENMKVYAKYQDLAPMEELSFDSFAQMDMSPDISFDIVRISGNIAANDAVYLDMKDGSDPVELSITDEDGDGVYTVKAPKGFNEGSSYELVLSEGWIFEGKDESIRTAAFSIDMEETANLKMNDDIVYIGNTDDIVYTVDGVEYDVLTSDQLNENGGTFVYVNADTLKVGDIICLYEGTKPTERDSSNGSELLDPAVYVKVTAINGDTVTFEPLSEEDQIELYDIPDNFPIIVDELPGESTGKVNISELDVAMYITMMGEMGNAYDVLEKVAVGDFITLYTSQDDIQSENDLFYGQITEYNTATGEITYKQVEKQTILDSMDLYAKLEVDGDDLITDEEKAQMEADLLEQVEQSDFAEEAAYMLADLITKTDNFRKNMGVSEFLLTDADGNVLSEEEIKLLNLGASFELSDDIELTVELITKGDQLHFGDGVQLAIGVDASLEVEAEDGKVAIDLSASFVQEVAIDPRVKGKIVYKEILWIPVPVGVKVDSTIDIKSYTAFSFSAEIYTVAEEDKAIWDKIKDIANDPTEAFDLPGIPEDLKSGLNTIGDIMDKIDELEAKVDQATDTVEQLQGYTEDIEALWSVVEGTGLTTKEDWEAMGEELEKSTITSDLLGLMDMTTETEISTEYLDSMQALMDKYSEMLEKETDWIKLVDKEIFKVEQNYYGVVIGVQVDFVVRADMSIAIGSNLEYEIGKRYNFWFKIGLFSPSAGNSSMDLIDERFAFQFYVMGKLGVKAGIQAKFYVGIGSAKFASVGITTELGPYIKLYGFFVYEYTKYRPANTENWTSKERMAGALYMEFGLYFMLGFEANALGDLFEYSYDFIDKEYPLLYAGEPRYYYACEYEPEEDEILYINDEDANSTTGITMKVPDPMMELSYVDLNTGVQGSEKLAYDKYNVTLSNPNFTFDKETGRICVNVPENTRYMECDLTITYLYGKMAFSQYDMTVTIPLVWTNLSTEELSEYYTASVRVGNDIDGYQTVWSKKVLKNQAYDLPTDEEIKAMIGWNDAKYSEGEGYGSQQTTGLTLIENEVYDYNVNYKTYALTVDGIQNADGSTYSKTFYAKYGESFDLSELEATGTRIVGEAYSKYVGVSTDATIMVNGQAEVIDLSRNINGKMADALTNGVVAQACYADNGVTVTFTFDGINHEDVSLKIGRGEEPDLAIVEDIVSYEGLSIVDITPVLYKIKAATTFKVICGEIVGPEATITFEENGGSEVNDIVKVVGSLVGSLPTPERPGYTFDGWYTDNGSFANQFTERKVPENGAKLYAKWLVNKYTLTFHVNGGNELEASEATKEIAFDSVYGELPIPTKTGFGFVGWFTESEGGVQVKATDMYKVAGDVTLYAQWKELKDIPTSVFDFGEYETYIYKTKTNRTPDYVFTAEDGETYTEAEFTFKYKIQGESDYIEGLPLHGGTYDVLVSRPADNDYAKFEYLYTGVLIIEYISFDVEACWYKVLIKENTGTGSERSFSTKVTWSDGTTSSATLEINKASVSKSYEVCGIAPTKFYGKTSGALHRTFHVDVIVYDILGNKKTVVNDDTYYAKTVEYNKNINVPASAAVPTDINVDDCSKIVINMTTLGVNGALSDVEYVVDNEAVTVRGDELLIDGSMLTEDNTTIAVSAKYTDGAVKKLTEFNVKLNIVE